LRFRELPLAGGDRILAGAWVLDLERHEDERGFFARTFCREELEAHGLDPHVSQCSLSYNRTKGTLRGMHWQSSPAEESKLVRVVHGAIHDVIVDCRPDSPTFGRHAAVELSAENRRSLYVPPLFAHGFQTLADDAEILYMMSAQFAPEHARGFRHDDPAVAIDWPLPVTVISDKDRGLPDFSEAAGASEATGGSR
jgi:dTDP-4-dehydrorhamnose 3,5-epimerase